MYYNKLITLYVIYETLINTKETNLSNSRKTQIKSLDSGFLLNTNNQTYV